MSSPLHYIVMESMVSPWREFLSLHQVDNLPAEILHSVLGDIDDVTGAKVRFTYRTNNEKANSLFDFKSIQPVVDIEHKEARTPPSPEILREAVGMVESKIEESTVDGSATPPTFSPREPVTPPSSPESEKADDFNFGFSGVTDTFIAIFKHL